MPTFLGAHNARIDGARNLLTKKGRKEQQRFSFEGPTLLREACNAGVRIEALYLTQRAYEELPLCEQLEEQGVEVYLVDERSMCRISDVETPSGVLAVAAIPLHTAKRVLSTCDTVLLLADVNDPGNAGTLLRTAHAFGVGGVLAGSLGVDVHAPKVVRAAMGGLFRLQLAYADPADLTGLLNGWNVVGLHSGSEPLRGLQWGARVLLAVGSERRGLGRWQELCTTFASIPMPGKAESLNAAVAGAIALYEATNRAAP